MEAPSTWASNQVFAFPILVLYQKNYLGAT